MATTRTISFPSYMAEEGFAAKDRADACYDQQDWRGALAPWVNLARQYPHEDAPLLALVHNYSRVALATQSSLPILVEPAGDAMSAGGEAEAAFLEALQRRVVARLEGMARCRGIRIRERRGLRAGRYLTRFVGRWPWTGPVCDGLYVQTLLPSHLAPAPAGRRRRGGRWRWPGRAILLNRSLPVWRPVALAQLLGYHLVAVRQERRTEAELSPLFQAAAGTPVARRLAGLRAVARRDRELLSPLQAMFTQEGHAAADRFRDPLLVHMLRQELRQQHSN